MREGRGSLKRSRPLSSSDVGISFVTFGTAPILRQRYRTLLSFCLYAAALAETIDFVLDYNGKLSIQRQHMAPVRRRTHDIFRQKRMESIGTQKRKQSGQDTYGNVLKGRGERQMMGTGKQELNILGEEYAIGHLISRRDRVISPDAVSHIPPSQLQPVSRPWFPVNTPSNPSGDDSMPPAFSADRPVPAPSEDWPPAFSKDQPSVFPYTNLPTLTGDPTPTPSPVASQPSIGPNTTISPSGESNTTMPSLQPAASPPPIDNPPPIAPEPTSQPSPNATSSNEPSQAPSIVNDTVPPTIAPATVSLEPTPTSNSNETSSLPSSSPDMDPTAPTISPFPSPEPSTRMPTISPVPTKEPSSTSSGTPTTPAPTTNCPPVPTDPPGNFPACEVCGPGMCISDPNAQTVLPGVTCGMFETNALGGFVNPGVCSAAPDFSAPCGCGFSGIPTVSPAPTIIPESTFLPTTLSPNPESTLSPSLSGSNQTFAPSSIGEPSSSMSPRPSLANEATVGPTGTIVPSVLSSSSSPTLLGPTISPAPTTQTRNPAEPVLPTKAPTVSPAPTITPSPTRSPVAEPVLKTQAPTTSMTPTLSQEPTAPTTSQAPSPGIPVTPEPLPPAGVPSEGIAVNGTSKSANKGGSPQNTTNRSRSGLGAVLVISGATMVLLSFAARRLIISRRRSSSSTDKEVHNEMGDNDSKEEEEIVFEADVDNTPLFGVDLLFYDSEDEYAFESDLTSGQLLPLSDV